MVFILGVDRGQLEGSAKTAFGSNLNFNEYYRKFVHREAALPDMTEAKYSRLSQIYIPRYLEIDGVRNCFMDLRKNRFEDLVKLSGSLKLTPRQVQEVFRVLGHLFETDEEKKSRLLWGLGVGSILMATLKVGDQRVYTLLGSQSFRAKEAAKFFLERIGKDYAIWWFMLCLTGGGISQSDIESKEAKNLLVEVGLMKDGKVSRFSNESGYYQGWGHHSEPRFPQIFEKIESILKWG
jgi:hypothetical protein